MDKWTEFKTAYRLAKLRTLSATAEDLGIHRSTVMRHIDALEAHIGVKLFQRNDKGYIPTEAGLEVMRLGEITDVQFKQFIDKTTNPSALMEGVLKITCVSELSVLLFPVIRQFQTRYPNVRFEILGDIRKYDLEYGEADLAIRMGEKPQTLDNIVIPFQRIDVILCAHQTYIEKHGLPTPGDVSQHQFLANSERIAHLPWNEWIHTHIPHSNIVTTSNSYQVLDHALHAGCGISIATKQAVQSNNLLHELAIGDHWQVNSWILVHRDIIHIPKVRKFIDMLKCASPFGET